MRMDLRAGITGMLNHGLRAYQSFAGLAELAENLRVLSLNAELAAARAGERGRGIRALTQLTRELVRQLRAIDQQLTRLQGETYSSGASVLKRWNRLRLLEAARERGADAGRLDGATQRFHGGIRADSDSVRGSIERLARQARGIAGIAEQAKTVATNVAIEAAHAGGHGAEFNVVADTMHRYVGELHEMIGRAQTCVDQAVRAGEQLQRN